MARCDLWAVEDERKWWHVVRKMRDSWPRRLVVVRRKLKGTYGTATRGDKRDTICVESSLDISQALYTLAEEAAHLTAGITGDHGSDHHPSVGAFDYSWRARIEAWLDELRKASGQSSGPSTQGSS